MSADRINQESLRELLQAMLPDLIGGTGGGGTAPTGNGGNGDGITASTLYYDLSNANTGLVMNHDLNSLNVQAIGKLPNGTTDPAVSVHYALDDNGQPDPWNVLLTCPANWTGRVYLLLPSTNTQTS